MNWLSHFLQEPNSPIGFDCSHCEKPLKCCDFTPFFPNFLIGKVLLENQNQLPVEMNRKRFHPLGLIPETKEQKVCDFFDLKSGRCKIWKNRPSECTGFFCKKGLVKIAQSDQEDVYKRQSYGLFQLELYLSQHALRKAGYSEDSVSGFIDAWNLWVDQDLNNSAPLSSTEDFDPFSLYTQAWLRVSELSWPEISEIVPRKERWIFAQMRKIV